MAGQNGATLLIVSDGHANRGLVAHDELAQVATDAKERAVTTSTLGVGLGYDESLLAEISKAGLGNAHFAEEADAAGALMAEEVEGLLTQVVQGASLMIKPEASVGQVAIWNDLPSVAIDGGIMVELGGFHFERGAEAALRLLRPQHGRARPHEGRRDRAAVRRAAVAHDAHRVAARST